MGGGHRQCFSKNVLKMITNLNFFKCRISFELPQEFQKQQDEQGRLHTPTVWRASSGFPVHETKQNKRIIREMEIHSNQQLRKNC